jgi:hypothetical protein
VVQVLAVARPGELRARIGITAVTKLQF